MWTWVKEGPPGRGWAAAGWRRATSMAAHSVLRRGGPTVGPPSKAPQPTSGGYGAGLARGSLGAASHPLPPKANSRSPRTKPASGPLRRSLAPGGSFTQ